MKSIVLSGHVCDIRLCDWLPGMVASYTTAFKIKINSKKRQNPLSYLLRLFTSCGKNYAVLIFFAQKTCFRLFAAKLRCFELNLTENNIFAFLLIHYAVFSFMVPKTCFCLFVTKLRCFQQFSLFTVKCRILQPCLLAHDICSYFTAILLCFQSKAQIRSMGLTG